MSLLNLRWLVALCLGAVLALPVAAQDAAQAPATKTGTNAGTSRTITVVAGDSGTALALRFKPKDATLEQTLVALWRANPQAFGESNLNLLREGATLRVPSTEEVLGIPADAARSAVVGQVEHLQAFLRQQKAATPTASNTQSTTTPAPAPSASPPGPNTEELARALQDALALKQALERQTRDAESHLVQLEQTIRELQRLNSTSPSTEDDSKTTPTTPAPATEGTSVSAAPHPSSASHTFSLTLTEPQLWVAGLGLLVLIGLLAFALRRRPPSHRPHHGSHGHKKIEIPEAMARIDLNLDAPSSTGPGKSL